MSPVALWDFTSPSQTTPTKSAHLNPSELPSSRLVDGHAAPLDSDSSPHELHEASAAPSHAAAPAHHQGQIQGQNEAQISDRTGVPETRAQNTKAKGRQKRRGGLRARKKQRKKTGVNVGKPRLHVPAILHRATTRLLPRSSIFYSSTYSSRPGLPSKRESSVLC